MTILVTGAAGFVGNNVIDKLVAQGRSVRAMVRNLEKAQMRLGEYGDKVEIVQGDVTQRDSLLPHIQGVTAIVHTVAISMEKGGQTYEKVNYQGTVNLVDVAIDGGVSRFINISQNGADSSLPYRFLASKGKAQDYVAASNLKWTALRPSAIFGTQDEFFNTFARLVRLTPLIFPLIGGGKAEFQPVSVLDVAEATIRSLDDDSTIGKTLGLGGLEVLTLGEIEKRVIQALNTRRIMIPTPVWLLRPAVFIMEKTLRGSPVSSSLLDLLAVPNRVEDNALVNIFGIEPIPFRGEHIAYLKNASAGQALKKFFTGATVN
ncbi:MAG: NAD(P)H-binding protein [Anaerolineae bacterium]|nr:NAD(P)H-binding protein [Anaerolineae bacterium]MDQ7034808.1 NAD(P)H-binding protein [Anaerolineae bacterium]